MDVQADAWDFLRARDLVDDADAAEASGAGVLLTDEALAVHKEGRAALDATKAEWSVGKSFMCNMQYYCAPSIGHATMQRSVVPTSNQHKAL